VRFNRGGTLMVPWGYVAGANADPIEKKPLFHVLPGSLAFSFGMLGCDLHCSFCQNWLSSQVLRDPQARGGFSDTTPEALVAEARQCGAVSMVSTYNEPLITAEWAVEVFAHARAANLATGFVSNGFATPHAIDYLVPHLDFCKVDLKALSDATYRQLGGRLQPVLDTIQRLHDAKVWVEVVTLLVPGLNDSDDELTRLAGFITDVSPWIPWHVTAFHGEYHMADRPATNPADLHRAAEIGSRAGLRFVYAGNQPGRVGRLEDTRCHACHDTLIQRDGFKARVVGLTADGTCRHCGAVIPGIW
jgi:pyruvate formate lyase activating enzyme